MILVYEVTFSRIEGEKPAPVLRRHLKQETTVIASLDPCDRETQLAIDVTAVL